MNIFSLAIVAGLSLGATAYHQGQVALGISVPSQVAAAAGAAAQALPPQQSQYVPPPQTGAPAAYVPPPVSSNGVPDGGSTPAGTAKECPPGTMQTIDADHAVDAATDENPNVEIQESTTAGQDCVVQWEGPDGNIYRTGGGSLYAAVSECAPSNAACTQGKLEKDFVGNAARGTAGSITDDIRKTYMGSDTGTTVGNAFKDPSAETTKPADEATRTNNYAALEGYAKEVAAQNPKAEAVDIGFDPKKIGGGVGKTDSQDPFAPKSDTDKAVVVPASYKPESAQSTFGSPDEARLSAARKFYMENCKDPSAGGCDEVKDIIDKASNGSATQSPMPNTRQAEIDSMNKLQSYNKEVAGTLDAKATALEQADADLRAAQMRGASRAEIDALQAKADAAEKEYNTARKAKTDYDQSVMDSKMAACSGGWLGCYAQQHFLNPIREWWGAKPIDTLYGSNDVSKVAGTVQAAPSTATTHPIDTPSAAAADDNDPGNTTVGSPVAPTPVQLTPEQKTAAAELKKAQDEANDAANDDKAQAAADAKLKAAQDAAKKAGLNPDTGEVASKDPAPTSQDQQTQAQKDADAKTAADARKYMQDNNCNTAHSAECEKQFNAWKEATCRSNPASAPQVCTTAATQQPAPAATPDRCATTPRPADCPAATTPPAPRAQTGIPDPRSVLGGLGSSGPLGMLSSLFGGGQDSAECQAAKSQCTNSYSSAACQKAAQCQQQNQNPLAQLMQGLSKALGGGSGSGSGSGAPAAGSAAANAACNTYPGTTLTNGQCACQQSGYSYYTAGSSVNGAPVQNAGCYQSAAVATPASGTAPVATISCATTVADVGMTIPISWSCQNSTSARADGFTPSAQDLAQLSGSSQVTVASQGTAGQNTYTVTCINQGQTIAKSCTVALSQQGLSLVSIPDKPAVGQNAIEGWYSTGMQSCTEKVTKTSKEGTVTELTNLAGQGTSGSLTLPPMEDGANFKFTLSCVTTAGLTSTKTIEITQKI